MQYKPHFAAICICLMIALGLAGQALAADTAKAKAEVDRMSQEIEQAFKGVPEITPKELADPIIRGSYVFLDVRSPKETAVSMIPGAIGVEEFVNNIDKYRDKELVLYCTIGVRSSQAVQQLMARGLKVKSLRGGLLGWAHAGLPINDKKRADQKKCMSMAGSGIFCPRDYEGVR